MKLLIEGGSLKLVLTWAHRAIFASAAAMLGYCAFVLADTWIFQAEQGRRFEAYLVASPQPSPPAMAVGLIGRIEIPRISLSVLVMEGTTPQILRRAAGHISGTALPGKPGNVGISAHRDTFFRPLRNIRRNDVITLTTIMGIYRYRVVSTRVVAPNDTAVLNSGESEVLTLVTCFPFYFVGSAPDRFIVRAERVS